MFSLVNCRRSIFHTMQCTANSALRDNLRESLIKIYSNFIHCCPSFDWYQPCHLRPARELQTSFLATIQSSNTLSTALANLTNAAVSVILSLWANDHPTFKAVKSHRLPLFYKPISSTVVINNLLPFLYRSGPLETSVSLYKWRDQLCLRGTISSITSNWNV